MRRVAKASSRSPAPAPHTLSALLEQRVEDLRGFLRRALRAWALDVWDRSGRLDVLRDGDARVLNWVRREALLSLMHRARADARAAEQVLTIATLEVTCRHLESRSCGRTLRL